ncbi:unnamed protein product, partial [Nippostrongylus brasiliensis]|uniref:Apple domain-containing protein n=1 Tax=Nippostrongylus brasiliensis TaxID=27835 RepID=A0A0N4YRL2_NIPBR
MLKRLLLYLCLLWRITAKDPEECSIRVDVLDGSDLVEAVALFLADSTQALDPQQCASDCFRHNCDVAYFDMVSRRCQFSSDTSETVRSSCDNFETVEMKAGVAELDKVKRYCIHCIEDEVHGGSERSADSNPHLLQVNSNDFEKKIVVTPAKTQQEISDFIAPIQRDSFERISDDNSHKSIGSTSESISMVIQEELPLVSPPNHKSTGTTSESKSQFSAQDDVPTPLRNAHKPVGTISV